MKNFKRFASVVMVIMMMLSMMIPAMAADGEDTVTISVKRDDTYNETANGEGRGYNWYRVFTATYTDEFTGTTGGGYDTDGTPGTVTGASGAVSYYASAGVAAKLGTWDSESGVWTKAEGNLWFDLTPISGSTNYVVNWAEGVNTDADTVQTAAKWLNTNSVYDAAGTLTWNETNKAWEVADVEKGYYLIVSDSTGANLIAATTNIAVNEKNDYPPIDKTQADEDNKTQVDDKKSVAVGDIIDYEVKITIPKTAAVDNTIVVRDTPSKGLTYNGDVKVKSNVGNATVVFDAVQANEAWRATITVTEGSQGKDVVFAFTMTLNENALTDSVRENEVQLDYGNHYTSLPDKVPYTTYFTGIQKIDGSAKDDDGNPLNTPLEGVKFTLKENGVEFKVSKVDDTDYYIPDAKGSSEVVTDANGLILIRGLDEDKTYTLTETYTLPGYNMLEEDVTLTLQEDTYVVTTEEAEDGTETTTTTCAFDEFKKNIDGWTDVANLTGTVLPSTGGIGTTIFYCSGAILALGAFVLLVTKKRMSREG